MLLAGLNQLKSDIKKDVSQCVKCGLCLPYCPTYQLTQNECESPRGRIAILDGFAQDQFSLSHKAQTYLDHCLTCRACEAVCPAHVPYGKLIDEGRTLQNSRKEISTKIPFWLDKSLKNPQVMAGLKIFLYFYQRLGLGKIFKLTRTQTYLNTPVTLKKLKDFYPTSKTKRGCVALFTGCIQHWIDRETILASIKILNAIGYSVLIPQSQNCCGALHQHQGEIKTAEQFQKINIRVFKEKNIVAIFSLASGCTASLMEYQNTEFTDKIRDILDFLNEVLSDDIKLKSLNKRVVLHTPCTLRNVVKKSFASEILLKKIPGIELISLPASTACCGAGGLYMLQHPKMSDELSQNLFRLIQSHKPDIVATSNIGCQLQLIREFRHKNKGVFVSHPITLISKQLQTS